MYSYEERKTAIELYIKYDFQVNPVIKELGYPSRRILYKWYKEFIAQQGFPKKHIKKSIYSDEQIHIAVKYYFEHGKSLAQTIRVLGYPSKMTLRGWIDEESPISTKRCDTNKYMIRYSEEEKKEAVLELCERQNTAQVIAQSHGVPRTTLYQWKNQLLDTTEGELMLKKKNVKKNNTSSNAEELMKEKDELQLQVEGLKKEILRLQLVHDILVKASILIKKETSINPNKLLNREKAILIDALKMNYGVKQLLDSLNMARSSYFYHEKILKSKNKYDEISGIISEIFHNSGETYGYRRVHAQMRNEGVKISEKVVRRIMQENSLRVQAVRKRKYNSYKGELTPAVENVINRDFHAEKPNQKWLTDITEFHIPAGKVYLSPVVDCFDGMVVTWSIGNSPDANLVNSMLDAAITTLEDTEHPVVHSDRGCHYRWPGWIERMDKANLIRSMSKKGYSPDNAACEGFFGRLKNEMFYGRTWNHVTKDAFIDRVNAYIKWYNEKRIKTSLGNMSPVEYRRKLGLQI